MSKFVKELTEEVEDLENKIEEKKVWFNCIFLERNPNV
jgi:hypothetical protein